jgi:hypothetical protein
VCSSSSASVERERQTPPEVVQIDKESFVNDITEIHQKFNCTTHDVRRYKRRGIMTNKRSKDCSGREQELH